MTRYEHPHHINRYLNLNCVDSKADVCFIFFVLIAKVQENTIYYCNNMIKWYKDDIKFAVLWSGISTNTLGGMTDFKENIVPHFIENFFKQPNYFIKDNKPVVFMYNVPAFIDVVGGEEQAEAAIKYWDDECKKEGFDGLMFISDGSSGNFAAKAAKFAQGNIYSYGWQYDSRNAKTQLSMNETYFATGANVVGSITMGWGRNPWSEKDLGEIFATPESIKETILGLKEKFKNVENPTNMIMLTCWDEYGEGHFFSPTRVHGFGYLNAVRDAVTSLGPKETEELPTSRALARMDSLNLGSRRTLKLLKENEPPVYQEDLIDRSKLQVLASWDFEQMGNIGGWKELKQVTNVRWENGALRGEATDKDPGVWIEGLNIPAKDVQMIRITTETEGAGKGVVYYQTSVDPDMGVNGKRFEVMQDSQDFKEYEAFPYNTEKLEGNITALRWDPQEGGFPTVKNFAIHKIEVLGYPAEPEVADPEPIKLTFNGENLPITRPPFTKDGVLYLAIHRPLLEMKLFKTKYDHPNCTYTIEFDGTKTAVLTVGSNIMKLDGKDIDLGGVCYYEDGNLFVPLRNTMEALGVTVNWNGEINSIDLSKYDTSDAYPYLTAADSSRPHSWMFETRGTEGWKPELDIGLFKAYKGSLMMEISGADPFFKSPEIALNASDYKYLKLRIKNETNAGHMYFFFIRADNKSWGGGKRYDIYVSNNDKEFKEYIIDLSELNLNETELRDSYDAVFHLVSAAKGAEEFYTLSNNKARTETVEEAAEMDDKLISAWTGHPHFRIIDNTRGFDEKMKRLICEISSFLGEPEPLEIERKFLIEYPDIAALEKNLSCRKVEIIQTYLNSGKEDEIRVRQRGENGNYIYFKTVKNRVDDIKRVEIESRLTKDEYLSLLMEADTSKKQIRKTRYCLTYESQYFEIDVYPFWDDKAIIEIELSNENAEITFPDYIKVIKEVTDDDRYKNASLAKNGGKFN